METPVAQQGLFDSVSQKVNADSIMSKLNLSKETLIQIGLYLGIGFVVGFVLKKYSKLFFLIVLMFLGLWLLQHMGFMTMVINWLRIQELLGIQTTPAQGDLGSTIWKWMTDHVAAVISLVVGFLAGMRLG